jgi:aminopeptidase YwaD
MKYKSITVLLSCLLLFCCKPAYPQDSLYARKVINTLTSAKYHGRGYVRNGDSKAAKYIAQEFKKYHVKKQQDTYFQKFSFGVNTFPSDMKVTVDGKDLQPGIDFIIYPSSASSSQEFPITEVDSAASVEQLKADVSSCIFISNKAFNADRDAATAALENKKSGAVALIEDTKLTWSVGRSRLAVPVLIILKKSLPDHPRNISLKIKSVFKSAHQTQNIIGYVEGKENPDSFLVFSAHYDHLGMMGSQTIFPGANDNASGIAMLLNMMKYYSDPANKPECSIVFTAFAGEEAGLVGSRYYTEHPVFDLKKIKFLINLDLVGTGDEGITVVNATEFKPEFELLKSINEEKKYLPFIGERGKAKNSDHYFFSEKGVPCFFIYTMGGIKAYHDVNDKGITLPLTRFKETFRLIRDFSNRLQ